MWLCAIVHELIALDSLLSLPSSRTEIGTGCSGDGESVNLEFNARLVSRGKYVRVYIVEYRIDCSVSRTRIQRAQPHQINIENRDETKLQLESEEKRTARARVAIKIETLPVRSVFYTESGNDFSMQFLWVCVCAPPNRCVCFRSCYSILISSSLRCSVACFKIDRYR